MAKTLVQLYRDRCDKEGNPLYWQPRETEATPFCLYTDINNPVNPEWGVESALSKSLCLNKYLEIDGAGFFVGKALKDKKIPDHPILRSLLKSNISDETYHQQGIEILCSLYPPSNNDDIEAQRIAQRWQKTSELYHPLLPVAMLEIGAFMVNLAFWRVFGGSTIASAAREIARDENRHAATNRSLLVHLSQPTSNPYLIELTKDTIAWVFEDLKIPQYVTPGFMWTVDNLVNASVELVETGEARSLSEVCKFGDYFAHFESDAGYSRATV